MALRRDGVAVIETFDLTKRYGRTTALDAVTLTVKQGSVTGLLGPNGAGKTTVFRLLLGLSRPTSGRIFLDGTDVVARPDQIAPRLAAMLEGNPQYPYLTALEMLEVSCLMAGQQYDRAASLASLDRVGLTAVAKNRISTYSQGMRQRLGLAMVGMLDRSIVILDEATNGLDPEGQRDHREFIRELTARGKTVVCASHLLHEVHDICSDVIIMNKGRVLVQGETAKLLGGLRWELCARPTATVMRAVGHHAHITITPLASDESAVMVQCGPSDVDAVRVALTSAGADIFKIEEARQTLEELFLGLIGSSPHDSGRS